MIDRIMVSGLTGNTELATAYHPVARQSMPEPSSAVPESPNAGISVDISLAGRIKEMESLGMSAAAIATWFGLDMETVNWYLG